MPPNSSPVTRTLLQIIAFSVFATVVGYFSVSPIYTYVSPEMAMIKLNFKHAGEPVQECRKLTQAELEELAPNMRTTLDCPRERVPLYVEMVVDGETVFSESVAPTGLAGDGASNVMAQATVPGGKHHIVVRMRDSRKENGMDYEFERTVEVEAGKYLVIDFDSEALGFKLLL